MESRLMKNSRCSTRFNIDGTVSRRLTVQAVTPSSVRLRMPRASRPSKGVGRSFFSYRRRSRT